MSSLRLVNMRRTISTPEPVIEKARLLSARESAIFGWSFVMEEAIFRHAVQLSCYGSSSSHVEDIGVFSLSGIRID
jgi:hypothetical protein